MANKSNHGPYVNLVCDNCNKKFVRAFNSAHGFGTCNVCDGALSRRKVLRKKQDAKAKKELKEQESCH